ncbi:hypothetical protein UVI_02008180 [Ustilaginoidea virens]|uniref:Transmembrane protein n=1 Tax=Ustilaginoidea virens TaxID=1159556 RepID=A0A1B5L859_USTVR|nr:hypothetical protein UVI_02008180 [Ustilaginoidea virens]
MLPRPSLLAQAILFIMVALLSLGLAAPTPDAPDHDHSTRGTGISMENRRMLYKASVASLEPEARDAFALDIRHYLTSSFLIPCGMAACPPTMEILAFEYAKRLVAYLQDHADRDASQALDKLVQVSTAKEHNIPKEVLDSYIALIMELLRAM